MVVVPEVNLVFQNEILRPEGPYCYVLNFCFSVCLIFKHIIFMLEQVLLKIIKMSCRLIE